MAKTNTAKTNTAKTNTAKTNTATSKTSAPATAEREPLTQAAIVAAAIQIADVDGVSGLSMRTLARGLGYEVMSLYNYVANKNELLSLMVDGVAAEIGEPATDTAPLETIRALAITQHEVLVRHPWAPQQWGRHLPGPARTARMEDLLRLFDQTGLSSELAHHGFHAVTNHVLGYTLQELGMTLDDDNGDDRARTFMAGLSEAESPYMIAHVRQHIEGHTASSFELVLDLILDGLVRLNELVS